MIIIIISFIFIYNNNNIFFKIYNNNYTQLFYYFEQAKKIIDLLLTLSMSKIKLTTKLPWEKLDAWAFFILFYFFLIFIYFIFFECLGIQFFNSLNVTYGTLCHARGHSHSCLGKQRISLGVSIILSICLGSHT